MTPTTYGWVVGILAIVLGLAGLVFNKRIAARYVLELRANPLGRLHLGLFGETGSRIAVVFLTLVLLGLGAYVVMVSG